MRKTYHITSLIGIILIYLVLLASDAHAIGEFSLGINTGITYDPNHLEPLITQWNTGAKTTATSVDQITIPYSFAWGINMRYQFNYFLFRIGAHFTSPYSVTGKADANKVTISTYQFGLPATVGLIMPLKQRTYFFIGAGITYNYAYLEWKETAPAAKYRYADSIPGFHYMMGAEAPITSKITLSVEWMHQEGRSIPIKDEIAGTTKQTISVKGDFLLFGVNYYISM